MKRRCKSMKGKKHMLFAGRRMQPCEYCGTPLTVHNATVDHVRPLSAGGSSKLRNCVLACKRCNGRKGSLTREQFIALLALERAA